MSVSKSHPLFSSVIMLALASTLGSCEKTYNVSGSIYEDCDKQIPYANQEVELLHRHRSRFRTLEKVTTDENGFFVSEIRLRRRRVYFRFHHVEANSPSGEYTHEFTLTEKEMNFGDIISEPEKLTRTLRFEPTQLYSSNDSLIFYYGGGSSTVYGPFTEPLEIEYTTSLKFLPDNKREITFVADFYENGTLKELVKKFEFDKCNLGDSIIEVVF